MNWFGELTPGLLIVMVIGLVELVKKLTKLGEWALLVSLGLGIAFGAAYELQSMYPAISPWLRVIVSGVLVGLSASGLYSFSKNLTNKNAVTNISIEKLAASKYLSPDNVQEFMDETEL